jgi:capsular exopolysaccharide synthesis family protein
MSRIFEALLRAQAEAAGANSSSSKDAQELLRQAEGRASVSGKDSGPADSHVVKSKVGAAAGPAMDPVESAATGGAAGSSLNEEVSMSRAELLREFPVKPASLSLDSRIVSVTDTECPGAEAFRLLGVRTRRLRSQNLGNKLLITSTTPEEGKSTVAANLACTLARGSQQSVLLIDGDLRRPVLAEMFGVKRQPGLCEYLRGSHDITESIFRLEEPNIWLQPSGDAQGNVLEVLQSQRVLPMMEVLGSIFDWVIIDSPPMLPLADTSIWERWADGIILVARQGVTRKRALQRGLDALSVQGKLVGAVINSYDGLAVDDYYYYRPDRDSMNETNK